MIAEIAELFGSRLAGRRSLASVRRRRASGRRIAIESLEPRLALAITLPIQDASGLASAGYDVWVTGHGIPGWQPAGAAPLYLMSLGSDGSFAQTATAIHSAMSSGRVATVTTQAPHGLQINDTVFIAGTSVPGYEGSYQVVTVPTATTFTYTTAASGLAAAGAQGTVYTSALLASTAIQTAESASFNPPTPPAIDGTGLATITTTAAHGLSVGQTVEISGVSVNGSVSNGYNGVFSVAQTPSATTFQVTYTAPAALANGTGGMLRSVALEPVKLSQLPSAGITLDAGLTNISAKLLFFVTPATSVPNGLPFNGNGVTPTDPPTPPYGPSLLAPTSIFDIVEFAYLPWGATETGSVATITTTQPHGFSVNESVTITGVVDPQGNLLTGYNQTVTVASVPTPQSFTFTATAGLADGGAGNVNGVPISGGFSTFDLSAVDGLAIPMTLTASQVKPANVHSVGIRPDSGFTRQAIGEAFSQFMTNDPLGHVPPGPVDPNSPARDFSKLLYQSDVTGPAIAGVNATWSNNTATFAWATALSQPLVVGQTVVIEGFTGDAAGFNGTFTVSAPSTSPLIPAPTTTSFAVTNTNFTAGSPVGNGGTVTPLLFQTPPLPDGQFASITAPKDWLGNQPVYTGDPAGSAANVDPLATFWDTTIDNFFQNGNNLSIYLGKERPPNAVYSGSSDGTRYTLSNGLNTYHFPKPTPSTGQSQSLANALYVWSQVNAPSGDEGLLQDQIWQALCRGVALDGVSTSAITNAETTTAWNDTTNWYTQHSSTAFPNFQSVYCPYSKFLHYSTLGGTVDTTGTTSIYLHNAAYGFGEDENPIGNPYTGPLVPSKLDGTVYDDSSVTIRLAPWTATATRPAIDLNGDGIQDVVWHNETAGTYVGFVYDGNGQPTQPPRVLIGAPWTLAAAGYFDADNVTDFVWRYDGTGPSAGANVLWNMNADGTVKSNVGFGGSPTTFLQTSGDYNGDGVTDLVWKMPSTDHLVWIMNAGGTVAATTAFATQSGGWQLAPTGADYDANGDGRSDLIWFNGSTHVVYLMNGAATPAVATLPPGPAEPNLAATGDFNGDGIGDLVWAAPGSSTVVQQLMGFTTVPVVQSQSPVVGDAGTEVEDSAVFWGREIVWRNIESGLDSVWTMSGSAATAKKSYGGSLAWRLIRRPGSV
ncbi:VCBS repeat-containing protein [bacterium]|nr:VCBS repeat-containing protein [bacterium]